VLLLWGHHCCGEGERGYGTQNFCTFCKCCLGVVGVVGDRIVVVAEQWKGKLLVDIAGAGGSWSFLLQPLDFATAVLLSVTHTKCKPVLNLP